MAVYQGARPRPIVIPPRPRAAAVPELPRRRLRGAVRARRGPNPVGLILGGIAVIFMLAFFWLAQTVSVSASGYDIDRLNADRDRLEAQLTDLRSNLNRLGHEPAIRKQALDSGLGQLAEPIVLAPR